MTQTDTSLVWGVKRAPLIALVGLSKSGKSSFLGTLYLRLKREPLGDKQFAGSLTLRGWASITEKMYWKEELKPGFPPRTSGEAREPGFLHLTVAGETHLEDILLADVPGEWFAQLLENIHAEAAAPARWIIMNADAVLFFIDTDALSIFQTAYGTERNTKLLLDRIASLRPDLPIVTVRAKHDKTSADTQQSLDLIQIHIEKRFGQTQAYETVAASVESAVEDDTAPQPGQGVMEALTAALHLVNVLQRSTPSITRTQNSQALASLQEVSK
ncbi:TRAFAC clade GTPase domain-containing protein [Deinococcus gobiensis]|nr:hypothetical protein [Deinococcus gobiensis]